MAVLLAIGSPGKGKLHDGDTLAGNEFKHNCLGLTTPLQDAPTHFSSLSH